MKPYKLVLIDPSKTSIQQMEDLHPIAVMPVDPHIIPTTLKEIEDYENKPDIQNDTQDGNYFTKFEAVIKATLDLLKQK